MSKLKELVERLSSFEYTEEEASDLANSAEAAIEEKSTIEEEAKAASSDAAEARSSESELEVALADAETRASEAEERADAATALVQETEADAEELGSRMSQVLDGIRSEMSNLQAQVAASDEWRTGVSERYGLMPSSGDEADNRAGVGTNEAPLVPEEDFEAARQNAEGGPLQLFRSIMSEFKNVYGPIYDTPDTAERVSNRSLNYIRAVQAERTPAEIPHWE